MMPMILHKCPVMVIQLVEVRTTVDVGLVLDYKSFHDHNKDGITVILMRDALVLAEKMLKCVCVWEAPEEMYAQKVDAKRDEQHDAAARKISTKAKAAPQAKRNDVVKNKLYDKPGHKKPELASIPENFRKRHAGRMLIRQETTKPVAVDADLFTSRDHINPIQEGNQSLVDPTEYIIW